MGKFLHIYIDRMPNVTRDQVEEKMNLAKDWFRYHDKVYIIYTTSDVDKWHARLGDLVKPDGSLFICRLDITDRNGWMKKNFWEWLKKPREDD